MVSEKHQLQNLLHGCGQILNSLPGSFANIRKKTHKFRRSLSIDAALCSCSSLLFLSTDSIVSEKYQLQFSPPRLSWFIVQPIVYQRQITLLFFELASRLIPFCEYLRNYPVSCSISDHNRVGGIAADVFLIQWEQ